MNDSLFDCLVVDHLIGQLQIGSLDKFTIFAGAVYLVYDYDCLVQLGCQTLKKALVSIEVNIGHLNVISHLAAQLNETLHVALKRAQILLVVGKELVLMSNTKNL